MLLEGGAEIDCNLESFGTPLLCAVENGHLNVVEYLIKEKVDINLGTMEDGHTPLMLATMENNLKCILRRPRKIAEISKYLEGHVFSKILCFQKKTRQ